MNDDQRRRYNRHLMLPEIGVDGQEKLLNASVLIVGVGGLGSPVSIYLAAAGVGTLGLVEFDTVDLSNLQRQILYDTSQIGLSKLDVAAKRIKAMNPDVTITKYHERLSSSNAASIFKNYDYILDATDNFITRYLINDTCVSLGKTYVYGSIYQFEGQVTVLDAKRGPCYRCLFPELPEQSTNPVDKAVLGVVPGVVGSIQATEIVKLICKVGDSLIGKMILYDALSMSFKKVNIMKNTSCPACSCK